MNAYDQRHAKRYALSLEALRPLLTPDMLIVECGARSSFADKLEHECQVEVEATDEFDLRHLPLSDDQELDVVLCMEVLEHLHDQEKTLPTEWAGSGTKQMLAALFSALKPGGLLFLTTPNAASLNVLHKVLQQLPPMVYRPHVREYAPHELAHLVAAAGFERITVTSHDCWDNDCMRPGDVNRLREMIAALGYRTDCRGEDLFLTAYKPKEPAQ